MIDFDADVQKLIDEYQVRYSSEFENILPKLNVEQVVHKRDELLMSVGPDAGIFLNILAKAAKAKTILELGTSYGHSTIYLAEAARQNGATVISCDWDQAKQDFARDKLAQAGLAHVVDFRCGDALEIIPALKGVVDFCLIDLWNAAFIPAFNAVHPKLAAEAYVVADNMIVPDPAAGESYRRHIRQFPDLESALLPIGWGLEVSRQRSGSAFDDDGGKRERK